MDIRSETSLARRLALGIAWLGASQALLVISIPAIQKATGISLALLGPAFGLAALAYLAGGAFWPARAADGRFRIWLSRLTLLAALCQALFLTVAACGGAMLPGAAALVLLFLTRAGYGFCAAGTQPLAHAWLASTITDPERRPAGFAWLGAGLSGGRVLAPLLTIPALLIWPLAALAVTVLLPLLGRLALPRQRAHIPGVPAKPGLRRLHWFAMIQPALLFLGLGQVEFVIGPYLASTTGLIDTGLAIATASILAGFASITLLGQLLIARGVIRADGQLLQTAPWIGAAGLGLALLSPWLLPAGLALIALATGLIIPCYSAAAANRARISDQTAVGSSLFVAQVTGHLSGVIIAGPLFTLHSSLPLACAAACVAGVSLVHPHLQRTRR